VAIQSIRLLAAVILVASAGRALGGEPSLSHVRPPGALPADAAPELRGAPSQPSIQGGGDDIPRAVVIPALPYTDHGSTCRNRNDYASTCASDFLQAFDVVYAFTPQVDVRVDMQVCAEYEANFHVHAGNYPNEVGCSDIVFELCASNRADPRLSALEMSAGTTYYIVIDARALGCGNYDLTMTEAAPPCQARCPAGAAVEGEPDCAVGWVDDFNGGCNSMPPTFQSVTCADSTITICGTYGTFHEGLQDVRDTDWYQIAVTGERMLRACVTGETAGGTQVFILDGNAGCPPTILASSANSACGQVCCQARLTTGTYWVWVGTVDFGREACGSPYVLGLSGYDCKVGVETVGWTRVKALYR
jgi:hypothetical protein